MGDSSPVFYLPQEALVTLPAERALNCVHVNVNTRGVYLGSCAANKNLFKFG